MLRHRLAEMARLDDREIEALLPSRGPARPPSRATGPRTPRGAPPAPEQRLLGRLLLRPDLAGQVPDEVLDGTRPEAATLRAVVGFCRSGPHLTLGQVSAYFQGTEHEAVMEEALREPLLAQAEAGELDLEAEVAHWVQELRQERLSRRQGELARLLDAGTATPEQLAEYKALYARMEASKSGNPPTEGMSKF
jgi:hypothetical protein